MRPPGSAQRGRDIREDGVNEVARPRRRGPPVLECAPSPSAGAAALSIALAADRVKVIKACYRRRRSQHAFMAVKPIPDGYHTVTPYLTVNDGTAALDFYRRAFSAVELMRMPTPDGKIAHAEIRIGDSPVMLSDEFPDMGARSPKSVGGTSSFLMLYVENVDAVAEQATAAGAKLVRPVEDQFYGDRSGMVEDPFGHRWAIATHVEDVPPDELARRAQKACSSTS
jgi:PhnB protein